MSLSLTDDEVLYATQAFINLTSTTFDVQTLAKQFKATACKQPTGLISVIFSHCVDDGFKWFSGPWLMKQSWIEFLDRHSNYELNIEMHEKKYMFWLSWQEIEKNYEVDLVTFGDQYAAHVPVLPWFFQEDDKLCQAFGLLDVIDDNICTHMLDMQFNIWVNEQVVREPSTDDDEEIKALQFMKSKGLLLS